MNARRISSALLAVAAAAVVLTGCDPATTGASGSASASTGCDPHGMAIFGGCPDGGSSAPTQEETAPATQDAPAPQGGCDPHGVAIFQPAGCTSGSSSETEPVSHTTGEEIAPADSPDTAKHEATHKAVAEEFGWSVVFCETYSDTSGDTGVSTFSDDPEKWVAFYLAGSIGAPGTADRSMSDFDAANKVLADVPAGQRAGIERAARDDDSRIIAKRSAEIARDARQLEATGSVS